MLCVCLDGKGVWGRIHIYTCVVESFYCPPEAITLLIDYTPKQNKEFSLKKQNAVIPVSRGPLEPCGNQNLPMLQFLTASKPYSWICHVDVKGWLCKNQPDQKYWHPWILWFIWEVPVLLKGFAGGSDGKESSCNVGDLGLIPGLGRSPGGGHGHLLQYPCLENPHGQRSPAGSGPQGRKELDTTEQLSRALCCWNNLIRKYNRYDDLFSQ